MKRHHAFLLVLAILLVCAASGSTQATARIYGDVRDASGAAVSGAQLRVTPDCQCSSCPDPEKCKCCPDQFTVITGSDGQFSFNVPKGSHHLKVKEVDVSVSVQEGEDKALQIKVQ